MHFKLVLSLVLAGLAVLFIIQNVAVVEISFMIWTISMSRSMLVFFILAIGILIGWLMHSYFSYHRQHDSEAD